MDKPNIDKVKLESNNIADENFEKLASLFPNVVTETTIDGQLVRAIDKDKLMQEINAYVLEGLEERYNFTWPDKRKSVVLANAPTRNTLRACKEESKDFDKTENLYIEGDNLEVLKLLRNTYMGKVKMIYIDPPYNTGKDFVYQDNFYINKEEYKEMSGQFDKEGNRLFENTEANGRFHTDWLNMMYPRLKMARDLLTDDGAIFISIDDNEVSNLRKICDEIFGGGNFVVSFCRTTRNGGGSMSKFVSIDHEYILMYIKNLNKICSRFFIPYEYKYIKRYKEEDEIGKYFWDTFVRNRQGSSNIYAIEFPNGKKITNSWIYKENEFKKLLQNGDIRFLQKSNGEYSVQIKQRINKDGMIARSELRNFVNALGTKTITDLLGKEIFTYAKPYELIMHFLKLISNSEQTKDLCNDIILDFFSGSATTAHAVMQLNAEDGGGIGNL